MNLNTILNNKHTNINTNINTDISELIESYYSLDNYNFINEDIINEKILNNFNPKSELLMTDILDNDYQINNEGIGLLDLSLTNNESIYDKLYNLCTNYSNIEFNKLNDKFIIKYNNKQPNANIIDRIDFNKSFQSLFVSRLEDLSLKQSIINIPNIISNEKFNTKIAEDLSYTHNDILRSDIDIENYINNLKIDLDSDNYKVKYIFEDNIEYIDKKLYNLLLEKLKEYNKNIDDIIVRLNKVSKLNINNSVNTNNISDMFDINLLEKLYNNNSFTQINMDDVLDKKYSYDNNKNISKEIFYNNIFKFLNELIKRKTVKIIKIYNKINLYK